MTDVEQFIARAYAYCDRAKLSPSTVSRKLLGNGKRLAELKAGQGSLRMDTFHRASDLLAQLESAC